MGCDGLDQLTGRGPAALESMAREFDSQDHQTGGPIETKRALEAKNSIEDFLAGLLGGYRQEKRGLLSAELRTLSALTDFASAATQIHAALISVRAIHAVMSAANCLGAARQVMDQLPGAFEHDTLKWALSTPPGPRLRQEIGNIAGAFFERAEAAAIDLRDPRWIEIIRKHGERATTGIVDYCQRLADSRAAGLSLPLTFQREIHLSMPLLVGLRQVPS